MKVDLPAPFGPNSPKMDPTGIGRSILESAWDGDLLLICRPWKGCVLRLQDFAMFRLLSTGVIEAVYHRLRELGLLEPAKWASLRSGDLVNCLFQIPDQVVGRFKTDRQPHGCRVGAGRLFFLVAQLAVRR